jgi:hypothetical protein
MNNRFLEYEFVKFSTGNLPLAVLLINLFIHINTAFYRRGLIVVDRWKIFVHYLRFRLWVDGILILLFVVMDLHSIKTMVTLSLFLIKELEFLKKDLEDAITL